MINTSIVYDKLSLMYCDEKYVNVNPLFVDTQIFVTKSMNK